MAQTNVIVTYAPAQRTAAAAAETTPRDRKRWGPALTGALLAGGAVFALGQFVRPDGTLRDSGVPARPGSPLASAAPMVAPSEAASIRGANRDPGAPEPLPLLALVSDVAASSAPPAAQPIAAISPGQPEPRRARERVAMHAQAPVRAIEVRPAETIGLVPPPTPAPMVGQHRDLEGFLAERGLVLAQPVPTSEAIAPVADWTEEDVVAGAGDILPRTTLQAVDLATLPASADAAPPAGIGDPLADIVPTIAASAEFVEVAPAATPEPSVTADAQRPSRPAIIDDRGRRAAVAPAITEEYPGEPKPIASAVSMLPTSAPPAAGLATTPTAEFAQSYPLAVVNGQPLGSVTLRDLGPQGQAVHLGALVGLLKLRMPEAEFARLSSAAAADQFVTLDRLRAAGITVRLDGSRERLLINAR